MNPFLSNNFLNEKNYNYNQYFYSIAKYLPKKLVDYYDESYSGHKNNRFHDCVVKSIEFKCDSYFYKNLTDSVKLTLILGNEIEYILNIKKINSTEIKFKNQKSSLLDCYLGEIIDCKLGLSNEKSYLIYFYTSTGFEFSVEFEKIQIKKLKLL